ncbi:MAG: hypothetical protein Marn2KO_14050 [Marinobacter nauticus]
MAENQPKKRALVTIETDVGQKRFFSIDDLSKWMEHEASEWNEALQKINTAAIRSIGFKWSSTLSEATSIEEGEGTRPEKNKRIKTLIEKSIEDFELISSINPIANALVNCRNAVEAEGFMEGLTNRPTQHMRNDQNRASGYIKGQIFRHQNATQYINESKKLKKLIDQWSSDYEELLLSIRETKEFHEDISEKLTKSQNTNIERLELLKNGFNDSISGLKSNFDEFLRNANDSLNSVKETYEKHMSLRASVDYWSNQATDHKNKGKQAFICLIAFTTFTVLFFLFFGLYLLNSATPDELKISAFSLSYGHAIKAIIFALTLSFLVWTIKLSNKTWHIHKHLEHDANERVTMMKTYLALASEEKNLKENDVELILSSLFRPAYDGIIKDETAPRSLADVFFREGK